MTFPEADPPRVTPEVTSGLGRCALLYDVGNYRRKDKFILALSFTLR
ncbi:MAG: hypothetical protein WCR20_13825 [Verrucomicrobiota bacterium]